jgi:hypothetical protein
MFLVRNIAVGTSIVAATARNIPVGICKPASNSLFRQWNQACAFSTSSDKPDAVVAPPLYEVEHVGDAESKRIFFYPAGVPRVDTSRISPWHDIPLFRDVRDAA